MVIVTPEPPGLEPFGIERCCLCDSRTKFWYEPHDVALCPACAQGADAATLPTKAQWCADQRRRHPPLVAFYDRRAKEQPCPPVPA